MRLPWNRPFDFERHDRIHRWKPLADYNSERHRGIVHTPEWDAFMAEEQAAFDAETTEQRAHRLR